MVIEKQQNWLICKKEDAEKSICIDLNARIVYSGHTNRPYARQNENHLKRLVALDNGTPQGLCRSNESILTVSEPTAIASFYWYTQEHGYYRYLWDSIPILQLFYTRQHPMPLENVFHLVYHLQNYARYGTLVEFANYMILHNITRFEVSLFLLQYNLSKHGIEIGQLTDKQKDVLSRLQNNGRSIEELQYIIRKMLAEHIEYILSPGNIQQYFDIMEEVNQPYNQKNFLKAFADNYYVWDMNKERIRQERMAKAQSPKFILEHEHYYIVMPTTVEQFAEMGNTMYNCISGYYGRVANGEMTIAFVYSKENGKPVANIDIRKHRDGTYYINQFTGRHNADIANSMQGNFAQLYENHLATLRWRE